MRAAIYEDFKAPLSIQNVPDPNPDELGVVIRVQATGLCRSDWHGWMGHDPDVTLPHVPGHERLSDPGLYSILPFAPRRGITFQRPEFVTHFPRGTS